MTNSPIEEVDRLHRFIETWMSGSEVEPEGWQDFGESFGAGFEITTPAGISTTRAVLLDSFVNARNAVPGVRIEIRNAKELFRSASTSVVRYEEWQLHPNLANERVSMVVLEASSEAPGGWLWVALHETRL